MRMKKKIKVPVISHAIARPRLTIGAGLGLLCGFFLPDSWELSTRLLVAMDAGMALYLALAVQLMLTAKTKDMQAQAAAADSGRVGVLLLTVLTAIASLAAIICELSVVKELQGAEQGWHIVLAGVTVMLSWLFMHTMFGIHYAQEYYSGSKSPSSEGLEFPQVSGHSRKPDYWDFLHFSYVIGVAAQTADIDITSHTIRRVVTLHCVVAFFFNTTVLALTVNIGAGLLT